VAGGSRVAPGATLRAFPLDELSSSSSGAWTMESAPQRSGAVMGWGSRRVRIVPDCIEDALLPPPRLRGKMGGIVNRVAMAAVLIPLLVCEVTAGSEWADALAQYERAVSSNDMHDRTHGRWTFSKTRDLRALRRFAEEYDKIQIPEERGTLVSMAMRSFLEKRHLLVHRWWRERNRGPDDAWLWYRGLILEHEAGSSGRAISSARSIQHPVLRAAALEALATRREPQALNWIPGLLADLPRSAAEREVLVGAAASVVLAHRLDHEQPAFRRAATALAGLLEDERTSPRCARVVRRHLAATFRERRIFQTAQQWRTLIGGGAVKEAPKTATDPRPEFFGIDSVGRSICYVIDMSDSMTIHLIDKERRDFEEVLGHATRSADTSGAKRNDVADVGKTRFDAVREVLKASLLQLPETTRFAVIAFGTRAGLLGGTNGFVLATRKNVKAMRQALNRVQFTKHGQLRGSTNLHGALRIAFGLEWERPVRHTKVSHRGHAETIFVLSDGMPNVDDWGEGMPTTPAGKDVQPYSSYAATTQMLEDVHRSNLLRKAEIHCVGVGRSSRELLRAIARLGLGMVRIVGGREPKVVDARYDDLPMAVPEQTQWLLERLQRSKGSWELAENVRYRIGIMSKLALLRATEALPQLVHALGALSREERVAALRAAIAIAGISMGKVQDVATLDVSIRLRGRWMRWLTQNQPGHPGK
jgi:hypothetical protein